MDFFDLIRQGKVEAVVAAISDSPNLISDKDKKGFPPLILASYSDQFEITKLLLEKGADVNALDVAGNTALMGVSFKGYTKIAELLIQKGAEIDIQNLNGATALIYAATFGRIEIAKLLVTSGADKTIKDKRGNTAFMHAEFQGVPAVSYTHMTLPTTPYV